MINGDFGNWNHRRFSYLMRDTSIYESRQRGTTYAEIARKQGISISRVRKIVAMEKRRRRLKDAIVGAGQ
jgi:Mor family transcriptional regulator